MVFLTRIGELIGMEYLYNQSGIILSQSENDLNDQIDDLSVEEEDKEYSDEEHLTVSLLTTPYDSPQEDSSGEVCSNEDV